MYASFQSLSQREAKRKALLRQAEKDNSIRNHLEERYKDTLWASDVQSNRITMISTRSSSSAQTEASIPPNATVKSVSFATNKETLGTQSPGVFNPKRPLDTEQNADGVQTPTSAASDRVFSLENEEDDPTPSEVSMESTDIEEELKKLQIEAHNDVKVILSNPVASNLPPIHPIFLPPYQNKKQSYLIGTNGVLYHTKSRKKVRDETRKNVEKEIDWKSTLINLNEKVQGYADLQSLRRRNDLRRSEEKVRETFNSLRENVMDKYANVITDQTNEEAIAAQTNEEAIAAQTFKENQDQLLYKNSLNIILTMNREASNKIKIRPFGRSRNLGEPSSVLGEAYDLNPLTLELSHNGKVLPSERANEIVSWESTLRNFLTTAGANKLQLNIPKELNIQYYAADRKHRLDDSTISNAPDASRPRTDGNFETKITFTYRNNPFLLEIAPISPIGFDGYEQDYVFGQDGKLLKRDTKEELTGESLNKARASILWGPTYQDLVNELIDGKNWLESQPNLTPDRVEILNNFNRTLKTLGVNLPLKRTDFSEPLKVGKGLKGAGVAD